MSRILIRTLVGDYHSYAVRWALNKKGIESFIWESSEFPVDQKLTLHINEYRETKHYSKINNKLEMDKFDVIWNRRTGRQRFSRKLHKGDLRFAKSETLDFLNGYIETLSSGAFWVNLPEAKYKVSNKPVQLKMAFESGLEIPETIFTNDPDEVMQFYNKKEGRIVYKPFRTNIWSLPYNNNDYSAINYTSKLEISDFEDPDIISFAPGIYQEEIDKKYELRIIIMGRYFVSVRIESQCSEYSKIDWRPEQRNIPMSEIEIPSEIKAKLLDMMGKANVVFGCVDMIVDRDDNYIFLEINEMGQFLWIESVNPEIRLLDHFSNFLISRDPKFKGKELNNNVRLEYFDDSSEAESLREMLKGERVKYQYSRFDSDDENYEHMSGIWSI